MWHRLTQKARESGELVVVGVVQEQHSERTRLYAQWQQFEWPILHDPINHLKARAVPYFVAIDEAGTVVDASLRTNEFEAFLARTKAKSTEPPSKPQRPAPVGSADTKADFDSLIARASQRLLWGQDGQGSQSTDNLSSAIEEYRAAIKKQPANAHAWFGLGVALRMRFDIGPSDVGSTRDYSDFQNAVDAWGTALELDPNQYIYRRRIQQYGPRLIKPYSFYDWVPKARAELIERGDTPIRLKVEPSGAEFAQPSKRAIDSNSAAALSPPDPEGKINRDNGKLMDARVTVVPSRVSPGETVRVHLAFEPKNNAHWNNEAEPAVAWVELPAGWNANSPGGQLEQPEQPESYEVRALELEISTPKNAPEDGSPLEGRLLFYVCEEEGGKCLYLRKDFQVPVEFK